MSSPPILTELILAELTPDPHLRDDVLGDLAEEYHVRCHVEGSTFAARWYWGAAISSAAPLALAALRGASLGTWAWGIAGLLTGFTALVSLFHVGDLAFRYMGQHVDARMEPLVSMLILIAFGHAQLAQAGSQEGSHAGRGLRAPPDSACSFWR